MTAISTNECNYCSEQEIWFESMKQSTHSIESKKAFYAKIVVNCYHGNCTALAFKVLNEVSQDLEVKAYFLVEIANDFYEKKDKESVCKLIDLIFLMTFNHDKNKKQMNSLYVCLTQQSYTKITAHLESKNYKAIIESLHEAFKDTSA